MYKYAYTISFKNNNLYEGKFLQKVLKKRRYKIFIRINISLFFRVEILTYDTYICFN